LIHFYKRLYRGALQDVRGGGEGSEDEARGWHSQ